MGDTPYEAHHDATITAEALVAAARLSDRYVTEYQVADKPIDLMGQAAAKVRLRAGGCASAAPSTSTARRFSRGSVDGPASVPSKIRPPRAA